MTSPRIRKAVFPVAGLGTRFLPATKTVPKEMLPIIDRPLIQYAVDEAIEAGCDTLVFVTNRYKHAVADYFDKAYELEQKLERAGKQEQLELVRNVLPEGVRAVFVTQPEARGLGHAVLCARPVVGDEPFAVLLPDDLIWNRGDSALKQMADHAEVMAGLLPARLPFALLKFLLRPWEQAQEILTDIKPNLEVTAVLSGVTSPLVLILMVAALVSRTGNSCR